MAISFKSTAAVGLSQQAISKVSTQTLHMPEPRFKVGEHLVTDQVVLHIMGVVFALQYSINKGIPLFGDRAEETISKTKAAAWFCYLPSCACPQLAPEQCKQALASLLCITAKWCSRIKDATANAVMTDSYDIPLERWEIMILYSMYLGAVISSYF